MLIIDDILLAPFKGIWFIFKKIHEIVSEELEDTPEKLQRELLENQMLLETEKITEEEYQKREKNILERLNALKPRQIG